MELLRLKTLRGTAPSYMGVPSPERGGGGLCIFLSPDWITSSADPNCLYHTTCIQLSHNLGTWKLCLDHDRLKTKLQPCNVISYEWPSLERRELRANNRERITNIMQVPLKAMFQRPLIWGRLVPVKSASGGTFW